MLMREKSLRPTATSLGKFAGVSLKKVLRLTVERHTYKEKKKEKTTVEEGKERGGGGETTKS